MIRLYICLIEFMSSYNSVEVWIHSIFNVISLQITLCISYVASCFHNLQFAWEIDPFSDQFNEDYRVNMHLGQIHDWGLILQIGLDPNILQLNIYDSEVQKSKGGEQQNMEKAKEKVRFPISELRCGRPNFESRQAKLRKPNIKVEKCGRSCSVH